MARIYIKKGDIFFAKIDENNKKYFQYITNDIWQLNSDVIRVFKTVYPLDVKPDLSQVVKDEIDFVSHCVINLGIKMNYWTKEGKAEDIGDFTNIIFRNTNDCVRDEKGELKKVSDTWYVWRIGDERTVRVGRLENENRNSYIGLVFPPMGIIELLKGNKFPKLYPDFE